MFRHFILGKERELVAVDFDTWALWSGTCGDARRVGRDIIGRFWISTVFLGLDHDFLGARLTNEYGGGIPVGFYTPKCYETMAFLNDQAEMQTVAGGALEYYPHAGYRRRARTWEEAKACHDRAVKIYTRYERMLAHREALLMKLEEGL